MRYKCSSKCKQHVARMCNFWPAILETILSRLQLLCRIGQRDKIQSILKSHVTHVAEIDRKLQETSSAQNSPQKLTRNCRHFLPWLEKLPASVFGTRFSFAPTARKGFNARSLAGVAAVVVMIEEQSDRKSETSPMRAGRVDAILLMVARGGGEDNERRCGGAR